MKKVLLATTAIAAGFVAFDAAAVDVELYGEVNKGIMIFDDGVNTEFNVVDNDRSSTRFGVKGEQALDNGLTASVLFEVEMQSNSSDALTQSIVANTAATPASAGGTFAERHARVGLAGDFGAVFIGQTSTATDGVTEQDLAGASDVMNSDVKDIGGGLFFRTSAGALTTVSVANSANNMDGNGRADVLRYDSPIFNGFQVRTSAAQGGDLDLGVFYKGKVDAFDVVAALGYVSNNDTAGTNVATRVETQTSGSISVKHDNGVAATVAYGTQGLVNKGAAQDDPSFYYVKLGYAWDAFEVAADYSNFSDINTAVATGNPETTEFGLAAQYNLGNGVSTAAYFKTFDYEVTGTNYDEINVYGVNLRVKF
jgi:hypothetical protein